jgi:hypothetical protein
MYTEIQGDLFSAIAQMPDKNIIIPHVTNDQGGWGSGFVLPLAKNFPLAEHAYRTQPYYMMGEVDFVPIRDGEVITRYVVNMCAQTLGGRNTGERDLKYQKLAECMERVATFWKGLKAEGESWEIVCPKFGSGLAGGNWEFIKELIDDCWLKRGINVTVYYL